MVKYSITKEEFEALSPELKGEYRASGDGYKLDVSGIDVKAQDKLEGERSKRRDAEKLARETQDAFDAFKEGDDRPQLVANHEKALAKEKQAREKAEGLLTTVQKKSTLDKDARGLAEALSKTNAVVLLPHILGRLDVDLTDPLNPKTVVLGEDGKPNGKNIDDLKAEFLANKDFAGIVTASQATGGAASRPGVTARSGLPSGSAPPTPPGATGAPVDLSKMDTKSMVAHIRAQRVAAGLEVPPAAQ